MKRLTVGRGDNWHRADKYVAFMYPQFARSAVAKLFDLGKVKKNGETLKGGDKLRPGDKLEVDDHLLVDEPPAIEIPILYEDSDCVVIDKPVGILSHSKGSFNPEATVSSWLRQHANVKDEGNRVGIVHRLDRTTSGVMICAKNEVAQVWLQKQFSTRNVKKTYIAIVSGHLREREAIIDMPIERNPAQPKTFRVSKTGKSATTQYKVLSETPKHSVVELRPTTGRTHQLRVHMRAIGHPIVGDTLYGGEPSLRIYLHALELELTLPNRERKVFSAPLPEEFTQGIS